jgi:hypothetical protein
MTLKRCTLCLRRKKIGQFYPRGDGRGVKSRCIACYTKRGKGLITGPVRPPVPARMPGRDAIADLGGVDAIDRRSRRIELAHLGGLKGYHEIRGRMAVLKAAKALNPTEEIPTALLDAVLPM